MTDREKLEKIKSLADKMYTSMQYLTSDTMPIRKAMDDYKRFIVHEYHNEEPVSDDLEEAVNAYIGYAPEVDESSSTYGKRQAFKAGAKWQRQRDEHLIWQISTANYEKGIEEGKQQMIKDAVDGVITFDYYKDDKVYGCVAHDSFCLEDRGLRDCDKVKIIVVKEG